MPSRWPILELSTPIIDVWQRQRAACVIIDLTGVESVDSGTANHILTMSRAVRLLGAYCLVSGIGPEIAQTLTHLEVDLGGLKTTRNLSDALQLCLSFMARLK